MTKYYVCVVGKDESWITIYEEDCVDMQNDVRMWEDELFDVSILTDCEEAINKMQEKCKTFIVVIAE